MEQYKLLDWSHNKVVQLTFSERRSILRAYKNLEKINHIYDSLEYIDFSIKNIVLSHVKANLEMEYGRGFSSRNEINFAREQNYLLNSMLSAFYQYFKSTKVMLKKLSDPTLNTFIKETNNLYESNKYYRIGYRLRQYSQHYAFPIKCAVKHSKSNKTHKPPHISLITPIIHKHELLAAKSFWNEKTKKDIVSLPNEIDVNEFIWGFASAIDDLHESIGSSLYKFRCNYLSKLSVLTAHKAPAKSPSNFYIVKDKNMDFSNTLSMEIIRRLDERYHSPKLSNFRNSVFGLTPKVDLEKYGYKFGVSSIPTAGVK